MDIRENKKKITAQLICLLLSMGLWFYINTIENPLKTYELNRVPVELLNADTIKDSNLALAPNQNLYVTLRLEGTSQQLFGVDRSDFKITVDLSEYSLKEGSVKLLVNIVEAPVNVTIKNANGLGITVNFENLIEKEIAIKSEINIISKSNYHVSNPVIKPESVVVSGAESLVNRVTDVVVRGEEDNISSTLIKDYKLTPVDENGNVVEGIQLSRSWVEVTIDVAEGKEVPIKIATTGAIKDGLRIKSIKAKSDTIGLTGPQNVLNNIQEVSTNPIDLSTIEDSITVKVSLNIPDELYVYDGSNEIEVEIEVEKVLSKEFNINYLIEGKSEDVNIIPEGTTVTVKVSGYEEVLSKITEANFKAILDVSQYKEAGEYTKEPTITLINADGITIDSIGTVKIKVTKEITTNGEVGDQVNSDNNT